MADINAYGGDASLAEGTAGVGGGVFGPTEDIGKYTMDAADKWMTYNYYIKRDQWNRSNQLKDQVADQAAKDSVFAYGDMLDSDKKIVDQKVGDFSAYFQQDPNSVRLDFDHNGRVSNGEAHAGYAQKRNDVNFTIARANKRKAQLAALDKQISDIKTPSTRAKAEQFREAQLKTGIDQDIQLYPDLNVFNAGQYVTNNMPEISAETLRTLPNEILNTQNKFYNLSGFINKASNDYLLGTDHDFHDFVDNSLTAYNAAIKQVHEENPDVTDPEEFKRLLAKKDSGKVIIDMNNSLNAYLKVYNSDELQAATGLGKVTPVDITDGVSNSEFWALYGATKAQNQTKTTITNTNDATEAATAAELKRQYNLTYSLEKQKFDEGKPSESVGNDVLQIWTDTMNAPFTQKAPGLVSNQGNKLYEVPVTAAMEQAFRKPLPNSHKEVVKTGDPYGSEPVTTETTESKYYTIKRMYVVPDATDKNPNKSKVVIQYENPENPQGNITNTLNSQQFFSGLKGIYGEKNEVTVSKMTNQALKKAGLMSPEVETLTKKFNTPNNALGLPSTASQSGKEPVELKGAVNTKSLVVDQMYQLNGKTYRWNGTNLVSPTAKAPAAAPKQQVAPQPAAPAPKAAKAVNQPTAPIGPAITLEHGKIKPAELIKNHLYEINGKIFVWDGQDFKDQ